MCTGGHSEQIWEEKNIDSKKCATLKYNLLSQKVQFQVLEVVWYLSESQRFLSEFLSKTWQFGDISQLCLSKYQKDLKINF